MNQINGKAWVEALRSGKYTQGIGSLRMEDSETGVCTHCCLGVVTQLAVAAGVIDQGVKYTETPGVVVYEDEPNSYIGTTGMLPKKVREWLEVEVKNPRFKIGEEMLGATSLNDKLKYTFAQIADLIEAQYLNVDSIDALAVSPTKV